ncbi:MAG: sugar ABC transporter permease [Ruminococcaceae bacterium]|nr:sugar ABC transporter permease [Oscillospiraceae bacterium]
MNNTANAKQSRNVQSVPVNTAPARKKKPASLDAKKARAGWFFVLPFVIGFVILYIPMLYKSVMFSFSQIKVLENGGYELISIGFDNYTEALFSDANFVRTLTESLKQLVLDVPAIVIFSLFMAIMLNQKMIGRAVFRAIFFIPVILTTGLIDQIDQGNMAMDYMNNGGGIDTGAGSEEGLINSMDVTSLLGNMAVGSELVEYVVNLVNDIFNIVNRSGVQMLIFLSGLQSISPAIYESCKMDGASGWETFWKVTFPMISPMILVNAIYTVIDSFTSESNAVMKYINTVYNTGTVRPREISSAMSWMYFLLVLVMLGLVALILSAFVFYQRKD